jgi:hypothetical protein
MTARAFLIDNLGLILTSLTALGLIALRRVHLCWSFFLYLVAVSIGSFFGSLWPAQFRVWSFYSAKETAYFVLKGFIAVEIWLKTFAIFPRARVRVGFLLVGTFFAVWLGAVQLVPAAETYPYENLVSRVHPRLQAGTLALYAVIVLAARLHRVPFHPLHRAILLGFALCLFTNALVLSAVAWGTWSAWEYAALTTLDVVAYAATSLWWGRAAWRPRRMAPAIALKMQPWAHSW